MGLIRETSTGDSRSDIEGGVDTQTRDPLEDAGISWQDFEATLPPFSR